MDISEISAPVTVAQAVALLAAARRPQSKGQKANNLIQMPHDRPRLRWEISGLIDGTDADCRRTDGDQWVRPSGCGCVPGIIPEGCCILSGHPKIGKSFLVLAVALAAASCGRVLGVEVEGRPVLYMAMEDGARRLQDRSRLLLSDSPYQSSSTTSPAMTRLRPWNSRRYG